MEVWGIRKIVGLGIYRCSAASFFRTLTVTSIREEDDFIREQVLIPGYKWTLIASKLTNAETYQVRYRYFSSSTPGAVKLRWTTEEDKSLLRRVARYEMNWRLVAAGLSGRSDI